MLSQNTKNKFKNSVAYLKKFGKFRFSKEKVYLFNLDPYVFNNKHYLNVNQIYLNKITAVSVFTKKELL